MQAATRCSTVAMVVVFLHTTCAGAVTPHSRGSIDNPSTPGILVNVG